MLLNIQFVILSFKTLKCMLSFVGGSGIVSLGCNCGARGVFREILTFLVVRGVWQLWNVDWLFVHGLHKSNKTRVADVMLRVLDEGSP
jgi:hypothetical protein